jgi:outer membrane protein assembly factor BamD (BamD/ComL family)
LSEPARRLQQLGESLQSGDLAGAQEEFNAIQTLAQNGPFDGNAFAANPREQDFTAIGQALQSGDLASAQQAFAQLQATFTSTNSSANPLLNQSLVNQSSITQDAPASSVSSPFSPSPQTSAVNVVA